ncbi:beta-galactosidase trimerization domain-containing protein [Kiritimatiellota bacterium B12222]|nr:beta-galactosidase trimerization domain-containing protein [Kiritimatiellota bacterium B12222]
MQPLRYRQIHLDFHSSEHLPDIGKSFDKKAYQATLRKAAVNSVTTFATCHHGWAYYETQVGKMHPGLDFDLLRAQFDAAKEIGIHVPIYLTAGVNNMAAVDHPEWRQIGPEGRLTGWAHSNLEAGFFMMCFNTGYLDFLSAQIREVMELFPHNDGIFLDIICQSHCVCHQCLRSFEKAGLDPEDPADRDKHTRLVLEKYYQQSTAAVWDINPDTPIFHNSGHITQGDTKVLDYFSHLELESLPTGGWGYDHFPISAKYCQNLPQDVLGMTGKFHTTWGEFGGFKHPNALRYECAQMLAVGAKCSVGDQLHPQGRLDPSTYDIIGQAYREVERKESWCVDAKPLSDIGVLTRAAVTASPDRDVPGDIGAGRILLEGHFLFDVVDAEMDFSGRKVLLLPDDVPVSPELKVKIDAYLAEGGKLILSGISGLNEEKTDFLWEIGASFHGESTFQPDYCLPAAKYRPDAVQSPMVMYLKSQRIQVGAGQSLGEVYDPYFNRSYKHFSSHQHAPNRPEASGYDCGVIHNNILYFAHPLFSIYRGYGAVPYRQYITRVLENFLAEELTVTSNLPSTARLHLNYQADQNRYVLHLLFANTVLRGGSMELNGGTLSGSKTVEVIEELLPLRGTEISLKMTAPIQKVCLEPQGIEIDFRQQQGTVSFEVEEFCCHQMVVLQA